MKDITDTDTDTKVEDSGQAVVSLRERECVYGCVWQKGCGVVCLLKWGIQEDEGGRTKKKGACLLLFACCCLVEC